MRAGILGTTASGLQESERNEQQELYWTMLGYAIVHTAPTKAFSQLVHQARLLFRIKYHLVRQPASFNLLLMAGYTA